MTQDTIVPKGIGSHSHNSVTNKTLLTALRAKSSAGNDEIKSSSMLKVRTGTGKSHQLVLLVSGIIEFISRIRLKIVIHRMSFYYKQQ
jgi:hypothetical protein